MSLFSDLFTGQRRRHDERDVRVNRDAGTVPSPTSHRAPARNAAAALRQIQVESPPPTPPARGYMFAASTLGAMRTDIRRFLDEAADLEYQANDFLGGASRLRLAAADFEQLLRIAATGPQVPLGDDRQEPVTTPAVAGDLCFGCRRSRDTLPCHSALEGRDVPLCARCHPSADIVEERDHDEPERIDERDLALAEQLREDAEAEPMRSTDPHTPHQWRLTLTATEGADPVISKAVCTDAALEEIAELAGDRAVLHYQGHAPWQEHKRHLDTLTLRSLSGETVTEYRRLEDVPLPEALVSEPLGAPSVRSEADAAGFFDQPPAGTDPATAILPLVGAHTPRIADTLVDLERVDGGERR